MFFGQPSQENSVNIDDRSGHERGECRRLLPRPPSSARNDASVSCRGDLGQIDAPDYWEDTPCCSLPQDQQLEELDGEMVRLPSDEIPAKRQRLGLFLLVATATIGLAVKLGSESSNAATIRGGSPLGLMAYLDLFGNANSYYSSSTTSSTTTPPRTSEESFNKHHTSLVIAGKMSVEDAPCNIAQYDLSTRRWSLSERIQLSLYNSY